MNIIPQPRILTPGNGAFTIVEGTSIKGAGPAADYLGELTGLPLSDESATITLTLAEDAELGDEGYALTITADSVSITAPKEAGLFYGVQTLRQLLPIGVESGDGVIGAQLPAVTIRDWPQYKWRGLHLDVGRHFFGVEFVKKYIDLMALYKLNVFHWHLTEDQGWRIEIKQYPKLTEIGSKRAATPLPADRKTLDGVPYEGFYTQDEIREVVAYAATRFVNVLPEIEMPGHAVSVLAGYPELGCLDENGNVGEYEVRQYWGIADEVLCAGNPDAYTLMENVLKEVFELFPSEYIHIGGDECPKVKWEKCPRCQAKIQAEGLKDEYELQSYFIRHMEKFLNDNGRRLIGWDEILEGGLAPNATVMSWRGTAGGIEAANAGHDVVMSPNTHAYFDYYQAEDTSKEPPAIGGLVTLERAYSFNPVEGLSEEAAKFVIGAQANVWTEYIPTEEQVEYMAYPRVGALAEAIWTASPEREFEDFAERLNAHLPRLDELDVHYRHPFK